MVLCVFCESFGVWMVLGVRAMVKTGPEKHESQSLITTKGRKPVKKKMNK